MAPSVQVAHNRLADEAVKLAAISHLNQRLIPFLSATVSPKHSPRVTWKTRNQYITFPKNLTKETLGRKQIARLTADEKPLNWCLESGHCFGLTTRKRWTQPRVLSALGLRRRMWQLDTGSYALPRWESGKTYLEKPIIIWKYSHRNPCTRYWRSCQWIEAAGSNVVACQ